MFIGHEVEVEIVDVLELDLAAGHAAVIEIAGVLTAVAAVALVLIAKARVANHARAVSLKTGKKTVDPNPGKNQKKDKQFSLHLA